MEVFREVYKFRQALILVLTPVVLLPIMVLTPDELSKQMACAYTILLMAIYWVSEVVPLAVTSLLPLVLYPFLGVVPAKAVSVQYLKDVNVLFFGGLSVAVAVEHWNLHKRIALKVLTKVGAKPRWLLFGFMTTTAFLSMWISNVATTAMMIPIAQAVLTELNDDSKTSGGDKRLGVNGGKYADDSSRDSGRSTPRHSDEEMSILRHDPHPSNVTNSGQRSHLAAEMGNIGQAQELGASLQDKGGMQDAAHYRPISQDPGSPTDEGSVRICLGSGDKTGQLSQQYFLPPPEETPDASTQVFLKKDEMDEDFNQRIEEEKRKRGLSKALTICVCYSANIGGTATLTGTGPNLILVGQYKAYPGAEDIDFGSWTFFAFTGMLIFLVFAWLWIQWLFLDFSFRDLFRCCGSGSQKTNKEKQMEEVIHRQYRDLGPMSFAEKGVLFFFVTLALLWLTRKPGFVPGWGELPFFEPKYVTDASVAIFITFCLFIFPSRRPNFLCLRANGDLTPAASAPALLTWNVVQHKMAWNVILLLGGSFAMALGAQESGLSFWIGQQLRPLNSLPPLGANIICVLIICALTQCTSNTATATVFLPILAELAEVLHVHPLYLMLPATLMTSYAFMLPVSTPPNAIAYSYGHLSMKDMMKAGFLMNLIGVVVCIFSVSTFAPLTFGTNNACPVWMNSTRCVMEKLLRENITTAVTD